MTIFDRMRASPNTILEAENKAGWVLFKNKYFFKSTLTIFFK